MKILIYSVLFLTLLVSIFIFPKALRVHKVKTLYDKDKIVYNFSLYLKYEVPRTTTRIDKDVKSVLHCRTEGDDSVIFPGMISILSWKQ